MNIAALLTKAARTCPERPAVTVGLETRWTYGALARRVSRLARSLLEHFGLKRGDRVALVMTNSPEYVEILCAAWSAGLTVVPINARLHPRESAWILDDSGSSVCFASADIAEPLARIARDVPGMDHFMVTGDSSYERLFGGDELPLYDAHPDSAAWLFYTSGTTGQPKGAMLTHHNLLMMTLSYFADIDRITSGDCTILAAPMSHGAGLYALPQLAKAANLVIPASGGFDGEEFIELLTAHEDASFFLAPTMVTRLLRHPAISKLPTDNVKTLIYGGAPMYLEDLRRALNVFGPKLAQIYGQGESPMTITALSKEMHADTAHPRYLERLRSAGTPRTDVEVRVVDENDRVLPPGETGEVVARGGVVMRGYWKNPRASAESLRGGWLHTGDLGSFDEEGFLTLKDRSNDLIISGGSNIYPREVEEVLLRHGGVLEASVVGRPHRDWGEEVVAFLVPRSKDSVTAEELDRLCLDAIARFKRPREYFFVESLPKNNYGKVLKTALREKARRPP